MSDFPSAKQDASAIYVTFEPNPGKSKREKCEFVLDFDAMGTVIGIEVINLKFHTGPNSLGAIARVLQSPSEGMTYSYDDDCDCFYLTLSSERSRDQKAVDGVVIVNQEGEIVALSAEIIA